MAKKICDYEREIKKALKKNQTYESCFDMYIRRAAMIAVVIDELVESITEHGAVIENRTREGHLVKKKNPACDDLSKMTNQYNLYMTQLGLTPRSQMGAGSEDPVSQLEKKINAMS